MLYVDLAQRWFPSLVENGRRARVLIMEPDGRMRTSWLHRFLPRRFWGMF